MGQNSSSPEKEGNKAIEEKESDIWSTVIHISDRDVLVQNIGWNKREKVKLNDGRKHSKMDNIHLADSKRLEGIPLVKKKNTRWLLKGRSCHGYPTGVVNQGCVGECGKMAEERKAG